MGLELLRVVNPGGADKAVLVDGATDCAIVLLDDWDEAGSFFDQARASGLPLRRMEASDIAAAYWCYKAMPRCRTCQSVRTPEGRDCADCVGDRQAAAD